MILRKDYDLEDAFAAIEDELIDSMMRNMKRHKVEEIDEDKQWEMWQALQLQSLEQYKKANREKFGSWFSDINEQIDDVIRQANQSGQMEQEIEILQAIKDGFKGARRSSSTMQAEFFKLNERKLDALIKATTNDMKKAEMAILRMADDQYRKAIFNAQVYANTGAGTYEKAVDMATKDMLSSGLNCVEYSNGARHTLKDYADMAIRTASKRAYLQGEGTKRQEWGISTVIINKRGNPCPKCLPFCGKILIDDVWSGGKASDGPYPLMSKAIVAGLYHPRCKDSHTTYFDGVSSPPDNKYTKAEIQQIEEDYREEQKQQYAKRQAEKYEKLEKFSLDKDNQQTYQQKKNIWKSARLKTDDLSAKEYVDQKRLSDIRKKINITEQWISKKNGQIGRVKKLKEYIVDGNVYKIDGKQVILKPKQDEIYVAEVLSRKYGKKVDLVPQVMEPKGIPTPDYFIDGKKYDLKSPTGSGKNVLYGMVSKNRKQASNFIYDLSNCPLDMGEIEKQIDDIYRSNHTLFVDEIVLFKDGEILKVYRRNK